MSMTGKYIGLVAGAIGTQVEVETEFYKNIDFDNVKDWTPDYYEGFIDGLKRAGEAIAEALHADNPDFNIDRFKEECGL